MKTVALGEVADVERRGVDPSSLPPETRYLGLEHIERGGRIIGWETLQDAALKSTKFIFTQDHVLFGKLRPNLAKVSRPNFEGVCSTDILPLRPGKHLDRGYLAHFLTQPKMVRLAATRAAGANLPRLSPKVLESFPIPLPALSEQHRIAAILDHADTLRAKRQQVLSHLDTLTQSIFHDMFGDSPGVIREMGEVAEFFGGASLPVGEPYCGQEEGALLMKVSDMNRSGNEGQVVATSLWTDAATARSATVGAGAVVLPKRGASIATNKKRLTVRTTVLDPNLMGVMPKQEVVASRYLFAWFRSFDLASITSGSSVPQLNKQDLAPLNIPVPPLERQHEFVIRVDQVQAYRLSVERALVWHAELFASLQSRAFRGDL